MRSDHAKLLRSFRNRKQNIAFSVENVFKKWLLITGAVEALHRSACCNSSLMATSSVGTNPTTVGQGEPIAGQRARQLAWERIAGEVIKNGRDTGCSGLRLKNLLFRPQITQIDQHNARLKSSLSVFIGFRKRNKLTYIRTYLIPIRPTVTMQFKNRMTADYLKFLASLLWE